MSACRTLESIMVMNTPSLILIVDDDAELSSMLGELLKQEGWLTRSALTIADGERMAAQLKPDVILLDVMLPDGNGFEACSAWRARFPSVGLIMLTARGEPLDRVLGLEVGADDYLAKPFEPRELVARIRALLRRQAPGRMETPVLHFDGLSIHLLKREVLVANEANEPQAVSLTSVEFKLLVALARATGRPLTREQLCQEVQWGSYRPQERTVDVQVARLRRKLRSVRPGWNWIKTLRGEGYVFTLGGLD